ncbi:hypothetical protein ACHAWF_013014 [Thalassiosira exigua]
MLRQPISHAVSPRHLARSSGGIRKLPTANSRLSAGCNIHHWSYQPSPSSATFFRPLQPRQWQKRRSLSESNIGRIETEPGKLAASELNERSGADRDEYSLHSNIHYLLSEKIIPVGSMRVSNVDKARFFLHTVSKWHNERGAKLSEALLERLYEEQCAGVGFDSSFDHIVDTEMYNACMDAWNKSKVDGEMIVRHVESIMKRMEERSFRASDEGDDSFRYQARPDRISYNCLINAYSKWDVDSSEKVEKILEKMTSLTDDVKDEGDDSYIRPDIVTYNSLMGYYASRKDQQSAAQRAEDLLLHVSGLASGGENIEINTTTFNIVLKAWGNSGGGIHAAERAEALLRKMVQFASQGYGNIKPDAISFSTVINAYSKVDPGDTSVALERTEILLDDLEGSFISDSDANIHSCYNAAANMIVKSGSEDSVDRVKDLMRRMKNMDRSPGGNMYISLIEAYAKEVNEDSIRRGQELLWEMMGNPEPNLREDSVIAFNILLHAILNKRTEKSLELAEEMWNAMEKSDENARPDLRSYSILISALSRSSAEDCEQKAVEHLRKMLKSYGDGNERAKPNSFVFNCVISMLARSKQHKWTDDVMYRTLMAMINQQKRGNTSVIPDTITYNLVIGKLAQTPTKDNAKKVLKLLTNMEDDSQPNAAMPDIISYTSVLKIQGKVSRQHAAKVASSCLERVMSSDKKLQIHVDRLGLRTLFLSLSKSPQIEHALLLHKAWTWMENSSNANGEVLDSDLCNLVLISLSNTKNYDGQAAVALSFLSERIERYNNGAKNTILPNMAGFGATLVSLSKAGRIDDALRILQLMKALEKSGLHVNPDYGCYSRILGSFSKVHAKNATAQALKVLRFMKEDLGHVTTTALNSALNICSREQSEKAIGCFSEIFRLGRESTSWDAETFSLMIRICMSGPSSDEARFKLVKVSNHALCVVFDHALFSPCPCQPIFDMCAKSGMVGNSVLMELKHFKKRLVPNDKIVPEWSNNAKDI